MAEYVIKHYKDGYEVEQERVGKEVAMSFILPHQTSAEQLKQIYAREDFDPETRLYAFKGDELVGFLTSSVLPKSEDEIIKASLTPPIVLKNHEEASELLFKKAIQILKKKGVNKVLSNFGAFYNLHGDTAKKWGYKLVEERAKVYKMKVSDIDDTISTNHIRDFDEEKDEKRSVELLAEQSGQGVEWAQGLYNWLKTTGKAAVLGNFIIEEDNEIVAQLLLLRNRVDMKLAQLAYIIIKDQKHLKPLMAKVAEVCKENNYEQLIRNLNKDLFILEESTISMGFKFVGKLEQYKMEL